MAQSPEAINSTTFRRTAVSIGLSSLLLLGCSDHSDLDRNPLVSGEKVFYAKGVVAKINLTTVNTRYSPRITIEPFGNNVALRPTRLLELQSNGITEVCIQDPILSKTVDLTEEDLPEEKVVSWIAWTSNEPLVKDSPKTNLYFNGYRNDTKAGIRFFGPNGKILNPDFTSSTIDLRLMQHFEFLKPAEVVNITSSDPLQKQILVRESSDQMGEVASYHIPCP